MSNVVQSIADALLARHQTLATAESCTGGLVGAALTNLPGSSAWYLGGVIAYSNPLKGSLLGVPNELLATHGAVSAETAQAMADGVRAATGADFSIALTGIAGPGGGTPQKPVGLVYIAVACPDRTQAFEHHFAGDRSRIRTAASDAALAHLLAEIHRN